MRLAIVGPPGSGKGTQTYRIAQKYNLKHVVVGDVVKQEIRDGTELGKIMYEYTSKGKFLPSEMVIDVLKKQIDDLKGYAGFIIDTAPINMAQKASMNSMPLDAVISLSVKDFDLLRQRMLKRVICPVCKKPTSEEDAKNQICPFCKNKLEKRYDDNIETINVRIEQYKRETIPVVESYREQGNLIEVDAQQTKEKVFLEICKKIDSFFKKTIKKAKSVV